SPRAVSVTVVAAAELVLAVPERIGAFPAQHNVIEHVPGGVEVDLGVTALPLEVSGRFIQRFEQNGSDLVLAEPMFLEPFVPLLVAHEHVLQNVALDSRGNATTLTLEASDCPIYEVSAPHRGELSQTAFVVTGGHYALPVARRPRKLRQDEHLCKSDSSRK